MILLTAAESRELDRLSQQKYGVGSYELMTSAGDAVARVVARRLPEAMARGVLVVAGKGNNGGDGLVAAQRLHQAGERARAVLLARQTDLRPEHTAILSPSVEHWSKFWTKLRWRQRLAESLRAL
jgi:ADP-dependent NAD(P)H-hydrate dehydratase / NAD(P)H-hydrate epimerase